MKNVWKRLGAGLLALLMVFEMGVLPASMALEQEDLNTLVEILSEIEGEEDSSKFFGEEEESPRILTGSVGQNYYEDLIPQTVNTLSTSSWKINGVTVPISGYENGAPMYNNDSSGCWAFASFVYQKIWGTTFNSTWKTSDDMLRNISNLSDRTVTAANAKAFLTAAAPGATVRLQTSNLTGNDGSGSPMHSMILVDTDENGCWIYHSPWSKKIQLAYYT